MPHNLYLHSSLVQTRKIKRDEKSIRFALKMSVLDSTIALNLAFFVNAAILVLAAATFFKTGRTEVAQLEEAHQLLSPLLGSSLALLFCRCINCSRTKLNYHGNACRANCYGGIFCVFASTHCSGD